MNDCLEKQRHMACKGSHFLMQSKYPMSAQVLAIIACQERLIQIAFIDKRSWSYHSRHLNFPAFAVVICGPGCMQNCWTEYCW